MSQRDARSDCFGSRTPNEDAVLRVGYVTVTHWARPSSRIRHRDALSSWTPSLQELVKQSSNFSNSSLALYTVHGENKNISHFLCIFLFRVLAFLSVVSAREFPLNPSSLDIWSLDEFKTLVCVFCSTRTLLEAKMRLKSQLSLIAIAAFHNPTYCPQ